MKLGLLFDLRNPEPWRRPWSHLYSQALEAVEEVERLGGDSVWVTEHHFFSDGYVTQPLVLLAAFAARTKRIRLGTGVTIGAFRHPQHLAEEATLVDLLSNGRLELGIGAGYVPAEYDVFGQDLSRRMGLTDRATAAVRNALWDPESLQPPPIQDRIPIWMGYQGPQGAKRAGRLGVNLLAPDPALLEPYREGLTEGGHELSMARQGGLINLIVASDPERTAALLAPFVHHQGSTYVAARTEDPPFHSPPSPPPDDLVPSLRKLDEVKNTLAVVTPDEAIRLTRSRTDGAPIEHLYFWASIAGMSDDIAAEHLELTFTLVRPELAD